VSLVSSLGVSALELILSQKISLSKEHAVMLQNSLIHIEVQSNWKNVLF
jgi:hypothetical protein